MGSKTENKEIKKPSKMDIIGGLLKKNFKNGEIKCELHYLGTKRII